MYQVLHDRPVVDGKDFRTRINKQMVRAAISLQSDNENPDIAKETVDLSKGYFSYSSPTRGQDTENTLINYRAITY